MRADAGRTALDINGHDPRAGVALGNTGTYLLFPLPTTCAGQDSSRAAGIAFVVVFHPKREDETGKWSMAQVRHRRAFGRLSSAELRSDKTLDKVPACSTMRLPPKRATLELGQAIGFPSMGFLVPDDSLLFVRRSRDVALELSMPLPRVQKGQPRQFGVDALNNVTATSLWP